MASPCHAIVCRRPYLQRQCQEGDKPLLAAPFAAAISAGFRLAHSLPQRSPVAVSPFSCHDKPLRLSASLVITWLVICSASPHRLTTRLHRPSNQPGPTVARTEGGDGRCLSFNSTHRWNVCIFFKCTFFSKQSISADMLYISLYKIERWIHQYWWNAS